MKCKIVLFMLSNSLLFAEFDFHKPSTGVAPIVFNEKLAYFSGDNSTVTIIDSHTNNVKQTVVSQRVISMFKINKGLCLITVDGHMQTVEEDGKLTSKKIIDNGGVISAALIGDHGNFALLAFQDGDQGLKVILYSKQQDEYVGKIIKDNLPKGVLASGRGKVWFISDQKSFEITAE